MPPAKIGFEITETAAIGNLTRANQLIGDLRQLGCAFSLDDFGSGVSSFAYLKALTVDFLKIDGLFVGNIVHDRVDYEMVRSITDIGHVMGKKVVAESVESAAVLEKLRQIGVDYAQGYAVGAPAPLDTHRVGLRTRASTPTRPADPSHRPSRPACVTTSATVASRSARTDVSIFIASIVTSTSPRVTRAALADRRPSRPCRASARRRDSALARSALRRGGFSATWLRSGTLTERGWPLSSKNTVRVPSSWRVAHRDEAHDQRLAALDVDA